MWNTQMAGRRSEEELGGDGETRHSPLHEARDEEEKGEVERLASAEGPAPPSYQHTLTIM